MTFPSIVSEKQHVKCVNFSDYQEVSIINSNQDYVYERLFVKMSV